MVFVSSEEFVSWQGMRFIPEKTLSLGLSRVKL